MCIKHNIRRLVYTSTSTVTLMPYMGRATFSLIINQTESKAKTPSVDNGFLIPGYPSSKLRAENIILGAYGATLANGVGMCYVYPFTDLLCRFLCMLIVRIKRYRSIKCSVVQCFFCVS